MQRGLAANGGGNPLYEKLASCLRRSDDIQDIDLYRGGHGKY